MWREEGDALDVDRALAGNWDTAYRSTIREWNPGVSCVTLNVAWGGNCNLTAEQLFWSGAVMVAISDILESAGFSTRINASSRLWFGDYGGKKYSLNTIVVKDHGEPLRVDALAGIVCHAGVWRSYGFMGICQAPWNVGYGLGHCIDGWDEISKVMAECGVVSDPCTINVSDCYNQSCAMAEINKLIKHFNPGE
jgi:hypothetical protein